MASALKPDLGDASVGSWPVATSHGNVDVNGDVGQCQTVATWTSSQPPAQKKSEEKRKSGYLHLHEDANSHMLLGAGSDP